MRFSNWNRIKKFISRTTFKLLFSNKFKYFGKRVIIIQPDIITGEEYIILKDNALIEKGSWLMAYKQDDVVPELIISEGVNIGRYSHIVSLRKIIIEKNVLIADKVYISDNIHSYTEINRPIKNQKIEFKNQVVIGENSWIGENVSIVGVNIGKHCIIGSNSVVTRDIMDYSVVVGIPAIYIKRYDFEKKIWRKTNAKGDFI
ncbi:acyltransferase [Aliarcobacter cryaerophilus]|uniref:acyltransferase n=1 Tax=Aliarcobacter cryaerophilus TaxID=28198 RepID=UPI0021B63102|nr:acyltransferase [Aliarcobacter cryaerophilus]MCT7525390.1 acyltransferase [Aliarcobacter cryaerophilus]